MKDSRLAPPAPGAPEDHIAEELALRSDVSAHDGHSEALCEILSQLNRDAALEDSAQALLPLLVASVGVETGAVLRVVSDTEAELLAAYGHTRKRGFPYPPLDLRDELLAPLTERAQIVKLTGADRDRLQPALRALCHPRFRSAFVASAFMGHTLGGFLVLSSRSERLPTAGDVTFLSAVADALGLALGSAALSQQSHISEVVLETAGAVARAISGSLDLAQTFRQIAHSAARVMGDCNCLLLATEDGVDGDLVAVACSDPGDDALLSLHVRFKDATGEREALARRRSMVVEDLVWGAGTDRIYREKLDIRSALFVPIHSEEELIGSLLLYSTARRDHYSERDIARAETVAEQAASAICNARLYRNLERSEYRATSLLERITQLRERQRLTVANVLHDDIVQTIVAALYQVEGLRAGGRETPEELERVSAMLKKTIADARSVIWDLRPPVLDGLGLDGALTALVTRAAADGDMAIESDLAAVPSLPPRITTALYVIAREGLQNIRKHARATHVTLSLSCDAESDTNRRRVRLAVVDDGIGFDPETVQAPDRYGLTMMDEQATMAGGSVAVTSRPGAGTTVEVVVPFPEQG